MKRNVEFINEDQKEPRCVAVWVVQSWGEEAVKDCTNYEAGKGVFVDYKIYGTLFDGAYRNYKKRDYGT